MLSEMIYSTLTWIYLNMENARFDPPPPGYGFGLARDFLPELLAYTIALGLVVYIIVIVRRRMRAEGEVMTPEHLRELSFIALALALLLGPLAIFWVIGSIQDYSVTDPWGEDVDRIQRLMTAIGLVGALITYTTIAFLSWRAYRRESADTTHHLKRGRVFALTLIVFVIISSDAILSYAWMRYYQILDRDFPVTWFTAYTSPHVFYYFTVLLCCSLAWLFLNWYRMRSEKVSMNRGQLQELAVITIGLWLLLIPIFIDTSGDYYYWVIHDDERCICTACEAVETWEFYNRLSIYFEFIGLLLIGLVAFRQYRRTLPSDVVPSNEPPGPQANDASNGSPPPKE